MIFQKLTIQNFMSIRSIVLDLQDRGLVLIKGKNCDNPDLNNNGSGKSSMIEAIVYALYGRTLRGVKGDAVVHKKPKKNMKIFLDLLDDDGTEYRIARYRKHRVNKNKSLLYRNRVDITPKSEADFNEYVANLLQADYLTFTSSLLYSAESFKFTSATDAEMKATFDRMLGLDVFSKCLEITKNRLKAVEGDLSSTQWKIDDRADKIATLTDKITEAEVERAEYEETTADEISEIKSTIKQLSGELKKKQSELKKLQTAYQKAETSKEKAQKALDAKKKKFKNIEALQAEIVEIKGEIKSLEQDNKREQKAIADCDVDIDKYQIKVKKLKAKMETLETEKADLDEDIGKPCPTCGQPMPEEAIEPARAEYDEKIADTQEEIDQYQKKIQKLQDEIKEHEGNIHANTCEAEENQKQLNEFQALIDASQSLQDEKEAAEQVLEDCQEAFFEAKSQVKIKSGEIEQVEQRIADNADNLEKRKAAKNPYDDIIAKYQKDQETAQKEIEEYQESIQDKLDEQTCLQFWQQAYSNQGIKSLILDDITPFLNKRVNKYLQKLTSGHIEVKFSTQTLLKSGETREKFSIDILNQDGGSEYIANSGGEKKRIDLCINLALQDLVASRSTKRINIAIWDEVFDALDETGIEKVIELLQELSEERSTILVVSHNPHLQSYFTNSITIQKKGGFSTLLGEDEEDIEE